MRVLILLLLLTPNALNAAKLRVIVHTREQVVRERVMDCNGPEQTPHLVERIVVASGWYTWHAVGGDAPYALIQEAAFENGSVFITVRDNKGRIARGTGTIRTVISREFVECPDEPAPAMPPAAPVAKASPKAKAIARTTVSPASERNKRSREDHGPTNSGRIQTVKRERHGDLPERPTSTVRSSGR